MIFYRRCADPCDHQQIDPDLVSLVAREKDGNSSTPITSKGQSGTDNNHHTLRKREELEYIIENEDDLLVQIHVGWPCVESEGNYLFTLELGVEAVNRMSKQVKRHAKCA